MALFMEELSRMPSFASFLRMLMMLACVTRTTGYAERGAGKGTTYLFDDYDPQGRQYAFSVPDEEKSTRECTKYIRKIYFRDAQHESQNGDDSKQCLNCDPTKAVCPSGCQKLINKLFVACDSDKDGNGVSLPDGFYFDYNRELPTKWDEALVQELIVQAGRCGCNSATTLNPFGLWFISLATAIWLAAQLQQQPVSMRTQV